MEETAGKGFFDCLYWMNQSVNFFCLPNSFNKIDLFLNSFMFRFNLVDISSNASFTDENFEGSFEVISRTSSLKIPTPNGTLYSGRTSLNIIAVACFCFLKRYSLMPILAA